MRFISQLLASNVKIDVVCFLALRLDVTGESRNPGSLPQPDQERFGW